MFHPHLKDSGNTPFKVLAAISLQSASWSEAERRYLDGRVSEYDYRWYRFFWTWTAGRFGGAAASKQDRAYERVGREAYFRRFERARKLYERWMKTQFREYLIV